MGTGFCGLYPGEIVRPQTESSMSASKAAAARVCLIWALAVSSLFGSASATLPCMGSGHAKVALMFLTRNSIVHKELWKRWLSSAADLTDAKHAQRQLCSQAPAHCEHNKNSKIAFNQQLFSLYIHSGGQRDESGKPAKTVNAFAEFEIFSFIPTGWGQPGLMKAERLLIQNALLDPDNQRFVLLSESCIPLYPPKTVYQQLMAESRSRINGCRNWQGTDDHMDRWEAVNDKSESEGVDFLLREEWRYSSQWKSLTRKHAELVAKDFAIHLLFERYCTFPCIADEHFIPSLLAHLQLEEETDCLGYLTYNTWDPARIELMSLEQHKPVDFKPEFVDKDMFYGMRRAHCIANPHAAIVRAGTMFTGPFHQVVNSSFCKQNVGTYLDSKLQYSCHLFSRKFGPQTVDKVLDIVSKSASCYELGILAPKLCRP